MKTRSKIKAHKSHALRNRKPQTGQFISGSGATMGQRINRANRFRETYNPLRNLTISRAVSLIESYPRGEFADLMWTFGAPFMGIECADPDLLALIERRTGAICEMDWNIKTVDEDRADFDQKLAEEQQSALREQYDGIGNLYEAFDHLAMATFRGFSHNEKIENADGDITELRVVDQWNVVRDGSTGGWKYNPDARQTSYESLPASAILDPSFFLIREVKRPVNRYALIKAIRNNLADKDWDAFIEIYGIPGWVIIGPPNVPADKESEYESSAGDVARGGSGFLPHGSDAKPSDSPRGAEPFSARLNYLSQKLILAGTGGLLTMLTQSGSGTLAGSAHMEAFKTLGRAEARDISEILQKQLDAPFLEKKFPGRSALAYFELASNQEIKVSEILDHAAKASQAGFQIDPDELSEMTGYTLTVKPAAPAPQFGVSPMENRRLMNRRAPLSTQFVMQARKLLASDTSSDLKPIRARIEQILQLKDEDLQRAMEKLMADLPAILKQINADPKAAEALEKILGSALAEGMTKKPEEVV